MYEEQPEQHDTLDLAMLHAKALNETHSNDCCEVKWVVEPDGDKFKVVRYNHQQ